MGRDGFYLLELLWSVEGLTWLRQIKAVEILRQVWLQQYYAPLPNGEIRLRMAKDSHLELSEFVLPMIKRLV